MVADRSGQGDVFRPEETKEKMAEEQEETAVRDLPVLDLNENQSDGELDNGEERVLL